MPPNSKKSREKAPTSKHLFDPLIRIFFQEWKKGNPDEEMDKRERQEWIKLFQQQSQDYANKLSRGLRLLESKPNSR